MRNRTRTAVVVPTAFLVAASGLLAAPASALPGAAPTALPAAVVNGAPDSSTATVTQGATATVVYQAADLVGFPDQAPTTPGYQFAPGTYWMLLDHDVNGPAADAPGQVNQILYQRMRITAPSAMSTRFVADGPVGSTYSIRFYEVDGLAGDPAELAREQLQAELADARTSTLLDTVTITVTGADATGPRATTSSPTFTYDDAAAQATEDLVFTFENLGALHDATNPFAVEDYAVLVTVTHADGTTTRYAAPVTLVPGTDSDVQYTIPRADVEDDATYTAVLHHAPDTDWEAAPEADKVAQVVAAGPVSDGAGAPLAATIADADVTLEVTDPVPSDEPTDEPTPPATPADPPATVDPPVYEGGVDDVTLTFDDLHESNPGVPDDRYAVVIDVVDGDGNVDTSVLTTEHPTDGSAVLTNPEPGTLEVVWPSEPDSEITGTLYELPADLDPADEEAILEWLAGDDPAATPVTGPNGEILSITATDADRAAATAQFFFRGDGVPAPFALVPDGILGSEVYLGDWDGDGVATPAFRIGNSFYLASANSGSALLTRVDYGRAGDAVYVGDWDGDGTDTFAVRRAGTNSFHLSNGFAGGPADAVTDYGRVDDEVIVGDWDGDGRDTPSVHRGTTFFLENDLSGGEADTVTDYGRPDDEVIIGDWDGDEVDSPSVRRGNAFHLKNDFDGGDADVFFTFGRDTDRALAGDVTGGGSDTIGVFRR